MNTDNTNLEMTNLEMAKAESESANHEEEKLLLESQIEDGDISFDENIEIKLDVQSVSSEIDFNSSVKSDQSETVDLGTEQKGNITF